MARLDRSERKDREVIDITIHFTHSPTQFLIAFFTFAKADFGAFAIENDKDDRKNESRDRRSRGFRSVRAHARRGSAERWGGATTHQNRASLFVLLRLHREDRGPTGADARGRRDERGHGLLEAEAGRLGRRDGEGGESVDERHCVRSV